MGGTANAGQAGAANLAGSAGASTCSDAVGSDISCTAISPGAGCAPFTMPLVSCITGKVTLKPKVAENLDTCITTLSALELCDDTNTYECLYIALDAACADSAAEATCQTIRATCTGVTQAECVRYANGASATGLVAYQNCMVQSSACTPQSCAAKLIY